MMPSATLAASPAEPSEPAARLASLDAYRGLVIIAMTFVNYLAGVKNIPAWAKHAPDAADAYTFVDLVFPAFLFIVGVAIPLALHKRKLQGESLALQLKRILLRSASLIGVGVIMVNKGTFATGAAWLPKELWYLLTMSCVLVAWAEVPISSSPLRQRIHLGTRVTAGVGLVILLALFRGKTAAGEMVWLQTSWWGILGLIGWAYLACSIAYLLVRGNSLALSGVLGLMLALYIGNRHGVLHWLGPVHGVLNVGQIFGSTAASVMMGVLVGNWFVGEAASRAPFQRARFFFFFGVGLLLAGTLVRPLHGINKIAATEAYALVSGGWCCLAFLAVYLLVDVVRWRSWAQVVNLVGQNAVLAYVLPGIVASFFAVIGLSGWLWRFNSGWSGTLNAVVLTGLICAVTYGLTRVGFRVRL